MWCFCMFVFLGYNANGVLLQELALDEFLPESVKEWYCPSDDDYLQSMRRCTAWHLAVEEISGAMLHWNALSHSKQPLISALAESMLLVLFCLQPRPLVVNVRCHHAYCYLTQRRWQLLSKNYWCLCSSCKCIDTKDTCTLNVFQVCIIYTQQHGGSCVQGDWLCSKASFFFNLLFSFCIHIPSPLVCLFAWKAVYFCF